MRRFDRGSWNHIAEDATTIIYGNCLSLEDSNEIVKLDINIKLTGGEYMVILTEWLGHPLVEDLLSRLRALQKKLQLRHPELVGYL